MLAWPSFVGTIWSWPFVAYAIVTGAVRADTEFLFAKNFGHSMARWIAGLFPDDIARLGRRPPHASALASPRVAVRRRVPLAVAFAGRAAVDVDRSRISTSSQR